MKKIAILVNTAAFSKYYIKLGEALINKGHEVKFLVINKFSRDLYFSSDDFAHVVTCCDDKHSVDESFRLPDSILSWVMHPDYDRGCYYGFENEFKQKNGIVRVKKLYKFLEENLQLFKPDYIFYENVSNCYALLAAEISTRLGIKYLGLTASRLPGKSYFSIKGNEIKHLINNKIRDDKITEEDIKYATQYLDNLVSIQPDYMKFNGLSKASLSNVLSKKGPNFNSLITHLRHPRSVGIQMGIPMKSSIKYRLRDIYRIFNRKRINKFYHDGDIEFHSGMKYYLYPLHYHPESSTSLLAKHYNEFELIRNIAFSLRENEYLIVKDHISASGFESYDYYKKISNLPNVIFAKPEINVKNLALKCNAIITLTSTVGYEGVLLNIPVLLFGTVFYEDHPLVTRMHSYHDIRQKLDSIDKDKNNYYNYNLKFVAAYNSSCFDFSLDLRDKDTSEGIDVLVDVILEQ